MNLLFANDRAGAYPDSWYAATAQPLPPFPPLDGDARADVAILGGGYTGLSTALHLAQRGVNVTLLEAHRVGFGASGRNGGQLGMGQRVTQDVFEAQLGEATARTLWDLGLEAIDTVRSLIAEHAIDCDLRPGVMWTGTRPAEVADLHGYAHHLRDHYGYDSVRPLSAEEARAICPSPLNNGGLIDHNAAHLHPLNFALGLARACKAAGVTIHEGTTVTGVAPGRLSTARGTLSAEHVILAGNGYLEGLHPVPAAHVLPINNFIAATEPLGDRAADVLREPVAVADSNFVVNYFRLSTDNRLLFGGGESYGYRFPADIAAKVRKPMERLFPALKGVPITHAWGGTLAVTVSRNPFLRALPGGIWTASGYSGHGVGTAILAGKLMAEAITGQTERFETMGKMPVPRFPGGPALRSPFLALAMSFYALRDRIGL